MDGNRRWAKEQKLSYGAGYNEGAKTIKNVMELVLEYKIPYITLYAFSTENWGRSIKEIDILMSILDRYLTNEIDVLIKNNIKLNTIGNLDKFENNIKSKIEDAKLKTCKNTAATLTLALGYGAREEIINATKKICKSYKLDKVDVDQLDEKLFSNYLYTFNLPDPDLVIRTGGEHRLSNFLLWQSTYAEIFFCEKMWPDFKKEDLDSIISWFLTRSRKLTKGV